MNRDNIKWNALIDAIERERCVLCIGPGVFTNGEGKKLEEQFIDYLQQSGELDDDIICYPDGLFYFRRESKRNHVVSDFRRFFKGAFPELDDIYRKLVKIPFNLIVFLTPDQRYVAIADEEGLPIQADYYYANQPSAIKKAPTKSSPIAYNLFGAFEEDESIILTYDDLFNFMQSIFAENRMSGSMRTAIQEAKHFVCLGLPFEKWYMQLLLRILKINNKRLTKYAANSQVQHNEIKSFFVDQFDITFVESKVGDFVDSIFEACKKDGMLREQADDPQSRKERIHGLFTSAKLEDAIQELEDALRDEKRLDDTVGDLIAHIKRRMKLINRERIKGIIDTNFYLAERAKIGNDFFDVLKEYY